MKKTSIKKIFKRGDKSPKTPTEEVWGELCTTKTPPKQLSPGHLFSSNKSPRSPKSPQQSSPTQQQNDGSSASSRGSRGSIEYSIDRRVSNGSSVEGMSRFSSRSISSTLKSTSSARQFLSSPPNRNGVDKRHGHAGRGSLQRYKSTSAVDVDAPIEAYEGPVDLDESIHSGSSGTISEQDPERIDKANDDGYPVNLCLTAVDAPMNTDDAKESRPSSPDTIPVVYEDCYDSSVNSEDANQRINHKASTIPPQLGIPLTSEFTNDENIDIHKDDDERSAVYSVSAINEEESIMEPMSTDEMEDEPVRFNSLPQRLETDDSALDDEDYYRQDYFSMMTHMTRIAYEDRRESEGESAEEQRLSSFSQRVLMSDESGEDAKRLSSHELVGLTEPDLPDTTKDDEDEGGDYGDLYTDASFPIAEDVEQVQDADVESHTPALNVVEENRLSSVSDRALMSKESNEIVERLSSHELIGMDCGDIHSEVSFPEDRQDGMNEDGHGEANREAADEKLVSGEPLSSFLKDWLMTGKDGKIEEQTSLKEMPKPELSDVNILASAQVIPRTSNDDIENNNKVVAAIADDEKGVNALDVALVDEEGLVNENMNISEVESFTDENSSNRQKETEPLSEPQDRIEQSPSVHPVTEDDDFVYESKETDGDDIISTNSVPIPDETSIEDDENSDEREVELIDIGNVIVEESNITEQEPSLEIQPESEIEDASVEEPDSCYEYKAANDHLKSSVEPNQGDDGAKDRKENDVSDHHEFEVNNLDEVLPKDPGMIGASAEHEKEDDQSNPGISSPGDCIDKNVANWSPSSPLVRSHSFVDSPSQSEITAEASPRRHSFHSMSNENDEFGSSIQQPQTPHKEITDNLVVAGVMSLFMGGGRFGGRNRAKTLMRDNITHALSTRNNKDDEQKLPSQEESPSMYSMPSLASPPTPLVTTATVNREVEYSMAESMQVQLLSDTNVEAAGEELAVIKDDAVSAVLRSRSLSPSPKRRQIERSTSLPVKWAPFPSSSPQVSLVTLSAHLKSPSKILPEGLANTGSDAINTDEAGSESPENGTDFPQPPLFSMNGFDTPQGRLSPDHSKASLELLPMREHMDRHQRTDDIDVKKLLHDNHRLRAKRKQLCESLGSIAKQFAAHEDASTEKIHSLEQKIRALVAEKEYSVLSSGNYDAETVRRLSTGVLAQDNLLEAKDKQISQLTLRLEVLRRNLHDKEESLASARKLWEEERLKMHNILTSPERQSHYTLKRELFESRMEVSRLKDAFENALSDIDALTLALESNNEALDRSVEELEQLRRWKAEHSNEELVKTPTISRTRVPTLSTSPSKGTEQRADMMRIQTDLAKELREIHDLVITSDRKDYNELEEEIRLLQDEAKASSIEAKLANERIEQLSSDIKAKSAELMKLQQERSLSTGVCNDENMMDSDSKEAPVEKMTASPSYSDLQSKDLLKDSSIVSQLESKIAQLEQRLGEYEKPAETNVQEALDTSDEDADANAAALDMAPIKEPDSETSVSVSSPPKKQHPPESPLTARNLFQPLRRGWATASPLIQKIATSPESRDGSVRDKDAEITKLNKTIKANTEVMEKLKRDIIKLQSEKEETEFDMTSKINKLKEENLVYASKVDVLEKAFIEMNIKRASVDGDEATDDGSAEAPLSPQSEKSGATQGENDDYQSKALSLQRSIVELESTQSHQEDEIEHLKAELVKVRVTSQQEKDAALEKLREEVNIVTAQRSALESQLFEINKSAGLLRDSLSDQASSPKKEHESSTLDDPKSPNSCANDGIAGGDPILVAQVVMLENANRVLESSVTSLRSDMQQKLAPLLEKIAMLEEEKRIMEDEMTVKLQCREMTITNLENSLQQLTSTRMSSKKKKHSKINSPPQTPSS